MLCWGPPSSLLLLPVELLARGTAGGTAVDSSEVAEWFFLVSDLLVLSRVIRAVGTGGMEVVVEVIVFASGASAVN